jgi:histidyl-tRNA synthetase
VHDGRRHAGEAWSLEAAGLSGASRSAQRLIVLRAIDKLDRLGTDGVRLLLGPGRKDESGDFAKGADLSTDAIERILAFAAARGADNSATLEGLAQAVSGSQAGEDGVRELAEIASLCAAAGYREDRIALDPAVVRGLEYYTGPVFEAELSFETKDEFGRPVRFGSVGGGGRYDNLIARFRGESVPSTGFSIGVSRLAAALLAIKSPIVTGASAQGPVIVLVLDRGQVGRYQELVARLRGAGVRAELYLGAAGMNAQLKYADRRGSTCAVIQGSNERDAEGGPVVLIRDLVVGSELAAASKDRADYLELRRRAQFSVAESQFVDAVRTVLDRHRSEISAQP